MIYHQKQFGYIIVLSLYNEPIFGNLTSLANLKTDESKALKTSADQKQFNDIYSQHNSWIFGFFRKETSAEEAEDLSQELWVICHENLQKNESIRNWDGYLYGIAKNTLSAYLRKKYRNKASIDSLIEFLVSNFKINGERILKLENSSKAEILGEIRDAIETGLNKIETNEIKIAWLLKNGFYDPGNVSRIAILIDKDEAYIKAKLQITKNGNGRPFIKEDNAALIMGITKAVYLGLVDEANQLLIQYLKDESFSKPCEELLDG